MPDDPMYDTELLKLAETERTFTRLLQLTPDGDGWAALRFIYFVSAERAAREINKRIKDTN